jgi:hypothetical protein
LQHDLKKIITWIDRQCICYINGDYLYTPSNLMIWHMYTKSFQPLSTLLKAHYCCLHKHCLLKTPILSYIQAWLFIAHWVGLGLTIHLLLSLALLSPIMCYCVTQGAKSLMQRARTKNPNVASSRHASLQKIHVQIKIRKETRNATNVDRY